LARYICRPTRRAAAGAAAAYEPLLVDVALLEQLIDERATQLPVAAVETMRSVVQALYDTAAADCAGHWRDRWALATWFASFAFMARQVANPQMQAAGAHLDPAAVVGLRAVVRRADGVHDAAHPRHGASGARGLTCSSRLSWVALGFQQQQRKLGRKQSGKGGTGAVGMRLFRCRHIWCFWTLRMLVTTRILADH
jgi:hypothetical protein